MNANRYSAYVVCGLVCVFFVMITLILSLPAWANNGCYRYITFKNEAAYIATAGISYRFSGQFASQPTGNFPVGQEKRMGVPCAATEVRAWAKAVAGNDIFNVGLGAARDRCFRLKGTSFNPRHESCDPAGTAPVEPSDCYKYITIKNQGAYVAKASVGYSLNDQRSYHPTGNFPVGQEKRVAVPCAATSVDIEAEAVSGLTIIFRGDEMYKKAEDRCYALKGRTDRPRYETCDPPGTPPAFTIDCYKQVTVKNEGAYVAYAEVFYVVRNEHGEFHRSVYTSDFHHGQSKQIPFPCSIDSHLAVKAVAGSVITPPGGVKLERNKDQCFVLKGTSINPRITPCPVAAPPEPSHSITIRNNGAYAAELTVTYSYSGERPTKRTVIQTRQRGEVNVPLQATNIYLKAKAIGGETIFEKNLATAQDLCYEVRGTTLITRYKACSN